MQIFYLLFGFRKKFLCVVTLWSFLNFSSLKLFSFKGILLKQGKVVVCVVMCHNDRVKEILNRNPGTERGNQDSALSFFFSCFLKCIAKLYPNSCIPPKKN